MSNNSNKTSPTGPSPVDAPPPGGPPTSGGSGDSGGDPFKAPKKPEGTDETA